MKKLRTLKIISAIIVFTLLNVSYGEARQIIEERGGRVKVVKYDDGTWQLLVNEKPYFIKRVVFMPVKRYFKTVFLYSS